LILQAYHLTGFWTIWIRTYILL